MSEQHPDISVVVCSVGTARLDRTIQSLRRSTDAVEMVMELIVVWDGKGRPPPPSAHGERYLEVFPGGLGRARNRGLEAAHGPLVAFVDDDEVVDETWAKGVASVFSRSPPPDGVFGAVAPLGAGGLPYCRFDGSEDRIFEGLGTPPWHVGTGGNMVFRRDVLLEGGGFDPTYGMNTEAMAGDESELTLRLLRRGRTLVFTPDMRVYHPTKTPAERLASRRTYGHAMGRALRHHRRGTTVARYLLELAQVAGAAAAHRNVARLREAAQQARGFMSGLVTSRTWLSPPEVLELAPPQIRELIDAADVQPLPAPDRPRPHLLYRVEEGRILHAYGWPAPSLFSALEARQVIRSGSDLAGIPQVHALAHGLDSIWLLEDRLPGEHPAARNARSWFDSVASWALALAGPPGPALHTTPDWEAWTDAALRISPPDLRGDLSHALEAVADLPAARVHGDFSRKNVLIHDGQVGAADWENCALLGLPGRDLLFLAVGAQGDRPDADVIVRLARGDDPPFGQLIGPLDRLGVSRDLIRPALLTILAGWAADEDRRLRELGATARSRDYLALLARCAEALRSRR